MKKNTAALYSPYLDTLGGGEKHIMAILEVLDKELGYQPIIYWHKDLTEKLKTKLGITFEQKPIYNPPIVGRSLVEKLQELHKHEIFLYVTDGSYFFSTARRNFVFCMVPNPELFNMGIINRLKTLNYLFISNSKYTHDWLHRWGISNQVLYPYISQEYVKLSEDEDLVSSKKKIILSVGRFFPGLHTKRQDKAIEAFFKLQQSDSKFKDYRLVLAGSVQEADRHYVDALRVKIGDNNQVELRLNPDFKTLLNTYKQARYYWHFAGYGVDDSKTPHMVEHLGIAPVEAMAAGCITCCYKAGGPRELLKNGENGFLFNSLKELYSTMIDLEMNPQKRSEITTKGQRFAREQFSYDRFKHNVIDIFSETT